MLTAWLTAAKLFLSQFKFWFIAGTAVLLFGMGCFVGARMEAGATAKQMQAFAKAQVQAAKDELHASFEESKRLQPYLELKIERKQFFQNARQMVAAYYANPRATPSPTTPVHVNDPSKPAAPLSCDDTFFSPDELRLYNLGNHQADFGNLHP